MARQWEILLRKDPNPNVPGQRAVGEREDVESDRTDNGCVSWLAPRCGDTRRWSCRRINPSPCN